MRKRPACKKRPCRICRRWYMPDPRVGDRQKTCGNPRCKRQWHRRKCAEWNKRHSDYFKSNYLHKKLETQSEPISTPAQGAAKSLVPPKSRLETGLPIGYVQDVIGIQHLIIIEYFAQLLVRRFQTMIKEQVLVNTG